LTIFSCCTLTAAASSYINHISLHDALPIYHRPNNAFTPVFQIVLEKIVQLFIIKAVTQLSVIITSAACLPEREYEDKPCIIVYIKEFPLISADVGFLCLGKEQRVYEAVFYGCEHLFDPLFRLKLPSVFAPLIIQLVCYPL